MITKMGSLMLLNLFFKMKILRTRVLPLDFNHVFIAIDSSFKYSRRSAAGTSNNSSTISEAMRSLAKPKYTIGKTSPDELSAHEEPGNSPRV